MNTRPVTTPSLLQMERSACGATALAIVLGYHGRHLPLAQLRAQCGVSRDGCSALDIAQAAREHGLRAEGRRVGLNAACSLPVPWIAHWRGEHFVVVEGHKSGKMFLNDPESGRQTLSLAAFGRSFSGVALVFEKREDFRQAGAPRSLWRALRPRLAGLAGALSIFLMLSLLATLPGLVQPIFGRILVDEILLAGQQDWLRPLLLGMLLCVVAGAALLGLQKAALRRLHAGLLARLSRSFVAQLLRLPVPFFSGRQPGEIVQRLGLQQKLADLLASRLVDASVQALAGVLYLGLMLSYDPLLTAVSLGCGALSFLALVLASRGRQDGHRQVLHHRGQALGTALAGLEGIAGLKACALEGELYTRWARENVAENNAAQAWGRGDTFLGVIPQLTAALAAVTILLIGGQRVMDGTLSPGMLVAFEGFQLGLQRPLRAALGLVGLSHTLRGDLERLDDVMQAPVVEQVPAALAEQPLRGALELCAVRFAYRRHTPLIDGLDLSLRPGQKLAVVGGSGSGKSTLLRLVAGLLEPDSGQILFDGQPREALAREHWSRCVAVVDQDVRLFPGSFLDNLSLWDRSIPFEQVRAACRDALIEDVILARPGGYDAPVAENGANLSGGQRQRLEIARALVHNPSLLLLDEAFSALDTESERRLEENLSRRGCSRLVIAHRLSSICDADEIVVLDQGRVVQRGRHAELLAVPGRYRQLLAAEGGRS